MSFVGEPPRHISAAGRRVLDLPQFLDPRLPERFWSKCMPEPNSGCWLWTASINKHGYGQFHFGRRSWFAHRLAFAALRGELPDRSSTGLVLDHRCRMPSCCNPLHLELVSQAVNVRRGWPAQKTTCVNGHPLDQANTLYRRTGGRSCRTCHRLHELARLARLAAGRAAC